MKPYLWLFALMAIPSTYALTISNGTAFAPSASNVTYLAPYTFICNNLTVDTNCVNISGGNLSGTYCSSSPGPITVMLGFGFLVVSIYNQQTEQLMNGITVQLEMIGTQNNNYTVTTGQQVIYNLTESEYELITRSTGYYDTSYFVTPDATTESYISLFLLNSTEGQRVVHTLYDQDSEKAEDITIRLLRWYTTSGAFKTVQMVKTNFEGKAQLYVELYDTYYKLQYMVGNTTYSITNTTYWFDTETEDVVNLGESQFTSWHQWDDGYHTIEFVNSSGKIYARYSYSVNSGLFQTGCLQVQRVTATGIYDVCENCTTSSTGVLSCYLNHSLTGNYKAIGWLETTTENSVYSSVVEWYRAFTSTNIPKTEGMFMLAILAGTMLLVGIGGLTGSLMLLLISVIGASFVGFVFLDMTAVVLIALSGFLVLIIVRRKN